MFDERHDIRRRGPVGSLPRLFTDAAGDNPSASDDKVIDQVDADGAGGDDRHVRGDWHVSVNRTRRRRPLRS
ncbi:hypothetical protein [Sodalis glossinidius]|uniref:hypothetical protein n=1 Tax=Sodalis glossinidius TaxID=63612 RepID=UPI0011D091CF|nr:hypothetical protein [Sodalis glossinidius]